MDDSHIGDGNYRNKMKSQWIRIDSSQAKEKF